MAYTLNPSIRRRICLSGGILLLALSGACQKAPVAPPPPAAQTPLPAAAQDDKSDPAMSNPSKR